MYTLYCFRHENCWNHWIPDISGRTSGHFQIVAFNLSIFGRNRKNSINLWHYSTPNEYKWAENKPMFTFIPHIVANLAKKMIRTFFIWKSGYRTKIIFLQLCWGDCPISNVTFSTKPLQTLKMMSWHFRIYFCASTGYIKKNLVQYFVSTNPE